MAVGIYKITSPTNKVYIGQSWELEKREYHYSLLDCKGQTKLYNSLTKHGWEAHKFEVVMNVSENVPQKVFDEIEQAYIDFYRNNGYELMNLRDAGSRGKHSEESKAKMKGARNGYKMPREVVERIASKLRGRKRDPEAVAKTALALKGRKQDPERVKKAADARRGHKRNRESDDGNRKPVLQYTLDGVLVKEWPCPKDVIIELGITGVYRCAQGRAKHAGKYVWKYKNEDN